MNNTRAARTQCHLCGGSAGDDALYLRGSWICALCEERLLSITPEAPSYTFYKERIALLWGQDNHSRLQHCHYATRS